MANKKKWWNKVVDFIHVGNVGVGIAYIVQALPPKPAVIIAQVILASLLPSFADALRRNNANSGNE